MKLQRREKILVGVCLGLVGLAGLWFVFFAGDPRSTDQLIAKQNELTSEIEKKEREIQAANRDAKRLAEWQRRSLPKDTKVASSLYQNWLRSLVGRVNFHEVTMTANDTSAGRGQFARISFTLNAKAKLGDLIEFLYEFYSAGFLHQIRDMTLKTVQRSSELDVKLTIEALSLPTAESKDQLPKEPIHAMKLAKMSDYREPIASRDFFAAYARPRTAPPRDTVDLADHAYVTGFTEVDGVLQVWLQDRIGGKRWNLGTGESFAVGKAKGTVQTIHPEGDVIIEYDGHTRQLRLGDKLHGGVEIPDPRPKQPDAEENSDPPEPDEDN
jgi:hypothetical protein